VNKITKTAMDNRQARQMLLMLIDPQNEAHFEERDLSSQYSIKAFISH
jgi:hypothetical protein